MLFIAPQLYQHLLGLLCKLTQAYGASTVLLILTPRLKSFLPPLDKPPDLLLPVDMQHGEAAHEQRVGDDG